MICGSGAGVVGGATVTASRGVCTVGDAISVVVATGAGAAVAGTGGAAVGAGAGVGDWAFAAAGPEAGDAAAPENAWAAATEHPTLRAAAPSNAAPVSWLTRRSRRSLARIGFSVTRRFS